MNSSTNPNNEFISFITRTLKKNKEYISATNLCGLMMSNIPKQYHPPKGQFNKWMSSIKNLEKNDNKDKDMPFYKWKEDVTTLENDSNLEQIIDNIKTTFYLWQKKIKYYRYPQHNMRMWNKLHIIFTENNNNIKIIQDKFPNLLVSMRNFYIDKMPDKPSIIQQTTNTYQPQPVINHQSQPVISKQTQQVINQQTQQAINHQPQQVINHQPQPVINHQPQSVINHQNIPVISHQNIPIRNPTQLHYTTYSPNIYASENIKSDKHLGPPPGLGFDEPRTSILFPITNNTSFENQHSLLFPKNNLDLSYQCANLLIMIKQLKPSDILLLNDFREILKHYKSDNLITLFDEILKIQNV